MALGTLPIPESTIPYSTPTLGTTGTCMALGLMISIGAYGVMDTTLCLAWYYVCRILRVRTWTITRIYEPIFYTCIIADNANTIISMLKYNWINIQHWSAYCCTSPIPTSCWLDMEKNSVSLNDHDTDPKCQWPTDPNNPDVKDEKILLYSGFMQLSLIVLAVLIVVFVVSQNERNMTDDSSESEDQEGTDDDRFYLKEQTHNIRYQAFMFVLACLVTWYFWIAPADENKRASNPRVRDILQTILTPLGGFWNMLIFVHIKIRLIRDTNHDIKSNFEAFMAVIKEPDSIPEMVLSGMEKITTEENDALLSVSINDGEEEGYSMPQEEASSQYTSHPSAYDDLLSESRTLASGSNGLSAASSLFSFMAAVNSNNEEKLSNHRTIPSYGAVNNNRTVRFALDDEEVAARGRIRRPIRRNGDAVFFEGVR